MLLNSLLEANWKWYPVLFDTPMNATRAVFFWLTIALVLAFTLCLLLIRKELRAKALKISLVVLLAYACVVGVTLLVFTFLEDGIKTILFVPLIITVIAVGGSAIALAFVRNKTSYIVTGCIVGAAFIATLVCMGVYYGKTFQNDGYYNSDKATVNQIVLYVSAVLLLALIIGLGFLFGAKDKKGFDSRSISYAAICIAMSFALSYLRILKMPQGGSVTIASLLPLMIYSYMFGTKKGVFACFIYGLLQAIQDPYIIHPAQFLLDYPIAFASIGVAGMFANVKALDKVPQVQFALGAVVASALRFICHVLSGVFAFEAFAVDEGMNAWIYSLGYNSFVFLDIAIAIVAGILVFSSKAFVKQARRNRPTEEPAEPQVQS